MQGGMFLLIEKDEKTGEIRASIPGGRVAYEDLEKPGNPKLNTGYRTLTESTGVPDVYFSRNPQKFSSSQRVTGYPREYYRVFASPNEILYKHRPEGNRLDYAEIKNTKNEWDEILVEWKGEWIKVCDRDRFVVRDFLFRL